MTDKKIKTISITCSNFIGTFIFNKKRFHSLEYHEISNADWIKYLEENKNIDKGTPAPSIYAILKLIDDEKKIFYFYEEEKEDFKKIISQLE